MKANMKVKTTRITTQTFRLTGEDILELLVEAGEVDMTEGATVKFQVPSGGDYSGVTLDVDNDAPVLVWVENVEEVIT